MMTSYPTLIIFAMYLACSVCIFGALRVAEFQLSVCAVISSLLQMLSLGLRSAQSLSNGGSVSVRALTLESLSIGCRLSSTMLKNGYLPVDATGDFLYQFVDACSFVMALVLRRWASRRQRQSLHSDGNSKIPIMPMMLLAFLFAALCHGCENTSPIFDTLWLAGLFLGLCASIPQRLLVDRMGDHVPVFVQHAMVVTYSSWMVSGCLMLTVFVYYVDAAEISLFTCAICIVYASAACLFVDCIGCTITGSRVPPLICNKQLAHFDEMLQSQRLPLLGGLRNGCMFFSVVLVFSALATHRALTSAAAIRFLSIQLKFALIFLNIVFFTKSSRKQSRGLRNIVNHLVVQFNILSKLPQVWFDRRKRKASKDQQTSESCKRRKEELDLREVDGRVSGHAQCATSLLRMLKDQSNRLKAPTFLLTIRDRARSLQRGLKTSIACRLRDLCMTVDLTSATVSNLGTWRKQDRWIQGTIVGTSMVLASYLFSDRNIVIFYAAGFLYTAAANRASTGLEWRTPSILRKGVVLERNSIESDRTCVRTCCASGGPCPDAALSDVIHHAVDMSSVVSSPGLSSSSCESTAAHEASEYQLAKIGSQTYPGIGNSGLVEAMADAGIFASDSDIPSAAVELPLRCEPAARLAVGAATSKQSWGDMESPDSNLDSMATLRFESKAGQAVDTPTLRQSWRDALSSNEDLTIETLLEGRQVIGQAVDASTSKQSSGKFENFDDDVTTGALLGCSPSVGKANTTSASKPSWGDLDSSDDEFLVRIHTCRHREAHASTGGYDDEHAWQEQLWPGNYKEIHTRADTAMSARNVYRQKTRGRVHKHGNRW